MVDAGGAKQQALDLTAGWPGCPKSGGDDGGVVTEKAVSTSEVVGEVPKQAVFQGMRLPIDDEQPRFVAPLGRMLRDQMLGEMIIEDVGVQVNPDTTIGGKKSHD